MTVVVFLQGLFYDRRILPGEEKIRIRKEVAFTRFGYDQKLLFIKRLEFLIECLRYLLRRRSFGDVHAHGFEIKIAGFKTEGNDECILSNREKISSRFNTAISAKRAHHGFEQKGRAYDVLGFQFESYFVQGFVRVDFNDEWCSHSS